MKKMSEETRTDNVDKRNDDTNPVAIPVRSIRELFTFVFYVDVGRIR